jgi:hypothetical protein
VGRVVFVVELSDDLFGVSGNFVTPASDPRLVSSG